MFIKTFLILLIPIVLISCASVSIQAVKDPSFSEPMNKLSILINHGQVDSIDPAYTQYLVINLKEEFTKQSMQINIQVVNRLSLNDNVYWADIAAGNPDSVMTIVASGGVTGPYGLGLSKIIYDISVF
ncbi:MAG: hypothetical protein JXR79_05895 [Nitrospirae bacterium]|nr:hypothetical protein [Nitrospirota bacterium]